MHVVCTVPYCSLPHSIESNVIETRAPFNHFLYHLHERLKQSGREVSPTITLTECPVLCLAHLSPSLFHSCACHELHSRCSVDGWAKGNGGCLFQIWAEVERGGWVRASCCLLVAQQTHVQLDLGARTAQRGALRPWRTLVARQGASLASFHQSILQVGEMLTGPC